jgi:hypothetical protein
MPRVTSARSSRSPTRQDAQAVASRPIWLDGVILGRLSRAGELKSVSAPDEAHEAMRDLIRSREATGKDVGQYYR